MSVSYNSLDDQWMRDDDGLLWMIIVCFRILSALVPQEFGRQDTNPQLGCQVVDKRKEEKLARHRKDSNAGRMKIYVVTYPPSYAAPFGLVSLCAELNSSFFVPRFPILHWIIYCRPRPSILSLLE